MTREVSVLFCRLWSGQKFVHSDVVEVRAVQLVPIILKQIFYGQVSGWSPSSRLQWGTHLFQASKPNMFLHNRVVMWAP